MYAVRTGLVVHAPRQVESDNADGYEANDIELTSDIPSLPMEGTARPATKNTLRLAPYILIAGLIGLIFLGLRLSPGLALFTAPTSTPSPQNTPTPIPHWNNCAVLPIARSDTALVAYGDQIYAIGGMNSLGVYGGRDRYDPQSDSWVSLHLNLYRSLTPRQRL